MNDTEDARCTELTCPHHGAANRAAYVPDRPYVRCRTGTQLVCTHTFCREESTHPLPPGEEQDR